MTVDHALAGTAPHDTARTLDSLRSQLGRVILGKPEAIDHAVVALLSGGHLLMDDVPGVGKTTLAKALARSFRGDFKRVQFTPDLLPTDILGSSVFDPRDGSFAFKEGPVFTNVLLADEINRASPRTQSALLEAMSEGQVSADGVTRPLPSPFLVIATQNPVEFHGTYPLPEAQLDRFALRVGLGYPAPEQEVEILFSQAERHPVDAVVPVLDGPAILAMQAQVRRVRVERALARYMVDLAEGTRRHPSVQLACSPRGTLALFRATQARAFLCGRDYAVPEDAKAQAVAVLAHRLGLETKARYSGLLRDDVVRELLDTVPVRL
jgi:MoxR-like ATPase